MFFHESLHACDRHANIYDVTIQTRRSAFATMPHIAAADVDRLFLQALLSRSVVSFKLARFLLDKSIDIVNGTRTH